MTDSEPGANAHAQRVEEELRVALGEAQAKAEANWNEFLRARAEVENVRKRAEREVDDARKFALREFLTDLLPVKDSLEKGLDAADREGGIDASSLVEGTAITLRQLSELLEKNGVIEIDPDLEQAFDPELHEAMEMRDVPGTEANVIVEVFQKGYLVNQRMVRPALVAVSSPGSKIEAQRRNS